MRDYINVNLLPIEYRIVKKDYSFLFDWKILVGAMAVMVATLSFIAGKQFIEATLATKIEALAVVQKEIEANSYVADRIKEMETIRDEKSAKNNSLKNITVNKKKWVRVLEGMSKSMPLNTWLDGLKQTDEAGQDLEVKGRTLVFPEVAEYMLELEKNEYFSKVTLSSIEFLKEKENSAFTFTLKITLNASAGIESFVPDHKPTKVL